MTSPLLGSDIHDLTVLPASQDASNTLVDGNSKELLAGMLRPLAFL